MSCMLACRLELLFVDMKVSDKPEWDLCMIDLVEDTMASVLNMLGLAGD